MSNEMSELVESTASLWYQNVLLLPSVVASPRLLYFSFVLANLQLIRRPLAAQSQALALLRRESPTRPFHLRVNLSLMRDTRALLCK